MVRHRRSYSGHLWIDNSDTVRTHLAEFKSTHVEVIFLNRELFDSCLVAVLLATGTLVFTVVRGLRHFVFLWEIPVAIHFRAVTAH